MFLVELVMQGVRGIRELARLRFQSGFNIVPAGNESGKTTAVDAVQRLLFPSSQRGPMAMLVSKQTPGASRAALVICSDDGAYYRVIQDFAKHAVNLSQYNTASKEFNLLHKDWGSAASFMGSLTVAMSEGDYSNVFVLRREHFADRSSSGASALASPKPLEVQPAPPAAKTRSAQARLAELRETLRKAEEAADADYRYQSAKLALEEIKKKLTAFGEIDGKRTEVEATLAELKGCEALPENLTELVDEHERRRTQKTLDADDLSKELEGLRRQLAGIPSVNVVTAKLFILGAVLGILSIVTGVFVLTAEYAPYFPVGVVLSLTLMATAWYNSSRKNAQRRAVQKDGEAVEKELADLERKFAQDGATVNAYMRSVGASTLGDLKEKAENYRYFSSLLKETEEGRRRILGDLTPEILQQQFAKQQAEVLELEQATRAVAQYAIDTYSIRQDIERLESESQHTEAARDFGGVGEELPTAFSPLAHGGFPAELVIAGRIGGIELETLVPAVEAAAQRNLSAATGGKYVRIELGHDGPPIVHAKDDTVLNFAELSHGTKALIYFCFRTGLVEALVGKRRLPFILDDALAGFDPARQQAACQILRALGAKTQVILFTSNPALKAAGDVAAELK